ncbi:MAG: SRPBCC family protein [Thermoleophilaceae bacterium]
MRVEESVEIERPPDAVWQFVADARNDTRWCPKVKSVEPAGEARWRVIHKPVPLRPPAELTVEQVDADPPRRLRLREVDEASAFDVEYRLEPAGAGTRFTQVSEFEWKKLPKLLHGTFARGVRRDVQRQLRELKRVLEERDGVPGP